MTVSGGRAGGAVEVERVGPRVGNLQLHLGRVGAVAHEAATRLLPTRRVAVLVGVAAERGDDAGEDGGLAGAVLADDKVEALRARATRVRASVARLATMGARCAHRPEIH